MVGAIPGTILVDSDIEVPTTRNSYFVRVKDRVNFGMEEIG